MEKNIDALTGNEMAIRRQESDARPRSVVSSHAAAYFSLPLHGNETRQPVNFEDPQSLKAVAQRRSPKEPLGDFPLGWYDEFLQEIRRRGIDVVTFRDLFAGSDDWNYTDHYSSEFAAWSANRDPDGIQLILQHDVDNHPSFTERMLALEAQHGVRSNVFIFRRRFTQSDGPEAPYPIDYDFLKDAERAGFVIGYHQNAFQCAGFDLGRAVDVFREDVLHLREHFSIDFMVPHGGVGREINGVMHLNRDVPMPEEFEGNLRWVFNKYGPRFTGRFSDGGIRKSRDRDRLERTDLIGSFLDGLRPGTRNFVLVHPQRWGWRVGTGFNPILTELPWYRSMIARYADSHEIVDNDPRSA